MNSNYGYMSLCYHYIRPKKNLDPFPRLLGIKIDEFNLCENLILLYPTHPMLES